VVVPMLMEFVQNRSGSFSAALYIGAGLLAVGLVLALSYRKPAVVLKPR
jgi:hypothetical protein